MFSLEHTLQQSERSTAVVHSAVMSWNIIPSLFLLVCLAMVVVVLVRIVRLVLTGRTERTERSQRANAAAPAGRAAERTAVGSQEPPPSYGPDTPLRSLRLTTSAAAFLVPMAMTVFMAMVVGATTARNVVPSENPFGIKMAWESATRGRWEGNYWESLFLLVFVAACLAGHVGLLRAAYANRVPTSADFLQGLKDHAFTFILGKLLLCLGVVAVSGIIGYRVTWAGILFVVPSLLLAPLVGTAALYPRRPVQAIKAALSHSTSDVHGTGKLVTMQIVMLLGAWMIYGAVHGTPFMPPSFYVKTGSMLQIPLLANGASTLSFNTYPMIPMFRGGIGEIAVIAFTVISSTVFLGCHFLKVMDTMRERSEEAAAAAAGHTA